ncbi:GNAT family N-acetyltransferase [Variovorax defluvii]
MTPHIRPFRHGDESTLWQVYFSAIHQIAVRDYAPEQIDAWAPAEVDPDAWAERIRRIDPFVAEQDGEILGYADLQPDGHIDHFFVSGAHPRQGVGTLLMRRLHEQAASLGVAEMSADVSRTAQPFFARHGFLVVEQRLPVRRGVVIPNALMRKTLGSGTPRKP